MPAQKFLSAVAYSLISACFASAQGAHLAMTPPMGWNPWNHFGRNVDDKVVRETVDAMVSSGMRDAGYRYIILDGAWEGGRDPEGNLYGDAVRFPDLKALGDYIHSKGLKFGIYSSPMKTICDGREPGSLGHEEQDARTFASWGVDYLKYDVCDGERIYLELEQEDPAKAHDYLRGLYARMHQELEKTGRPIVYSICEYGLDAVWRWGAEAGGNLWRTTSDIRASYTEISQNGFTQAGLSTFAGPGHWNDPDMLEIGNPGVQADVSRTQMSLWAILAAPLIAGNDIREMDETTREILLNREIIAIDQDPLGRQGDRVRCQGPLELWMKPLEGGAKAVAVFNRGRSKMDFSFSFAEVGFAGKVEVRDLWLHRNLGVKSGVDRVRVPKHDVEMYRLSRPGSM
jgi:alpha-galactosidase